MYPLPPPNFEAPHTGLPFKAFELHAVSIMPKASI